MEAASQQCKIASAGVDWITATSTSTSLAKELWWAGESAGAADRDEGSEVRPWACYGYHGWSTDHATWAARHDGVLVRLGGEVADSHWREVARFAERVTRLDCQATVYFQEPELAIAEEIYARIPGIRGREGRPVTGRLIMGTTGGRTVYVGSRSSTSVGRVYDKGVEGESHAPGHLWRYEVEFKREAARTTQGDLEPHDDAAAAAAWLVRQWFSRRQIEVPFHLETAFVCNEPPRRPRSTRQIEWLARAVRPTVQRLSQRGLRERVLSALGLRDSSAHEERTGDSVPNA